MNLKAADTIRLALFVLFASTASQTFGQSFEQVAVGSAHICGLDSAGQVECTTTPIAERFLPPDNLPAMSAITAGQQHSCGITLDGEVQCWGTNAFGVLQAPAFDAPVMSITSGFNHNCAVDANNQVQCWGLDTNGQLNVPDVVGGFVKVDAARNASCGIDTNGDIHCWSNDFFYTADGTITGPFVDLDIDANQACGLTANGDIECWASRERNMLVPPGNGPYTDLTVTNSAICGLRSDQLLDCSFAARTSFPLDTASEQYPLDVRYSSIERSSLQFAGVPICGIRADNGTISCFGASGSSIALPAPPGASAISSTLTADNIVLSLTAKIYGRNQVELFWNQVPSVFPLISVEVYRDDELLITTRNSFSFYDNDDSVTSEESRYRVRTIDAAGNIGEFSKEIVVNRSTFQVNVLDDNVDSPRGESQLRIQDLAIVAFSQFDARNDIFILSWSIDNPSSVAVAGFEIRINNEDTDFVSATTYVGEGATRDECRVYSVAAIATGGEILDYATVAFGASASQCPR